MASEVEQLRARVQALEEVCGEMYQVAGAAGAPERVLDKLWAAAQGDAISTASVLPVLETEFEEVAERDAVIQRIVDAIGPAFAAQRGRKGGSVSSAAKRRAARLNGRKGGRPRKSASTR